MIKISVLKLQTLRLFNDFIKAPVAHIEGGT
jgi:hypothetical protein